jgi:hypothetical protein
VLLHAAQLQQGCPLVPVLRLSLLVQQQRVILAVATATLLQAHSILTQVGVLQAAVTTRPSSSRKPHAPLLSTRRQMQQLRWQQPLQQ